MPSVASVVRVNAANRGLVPTKGTAVRDELKAEPMLLLYRRLLDTGFEEAKLMRYGQPTDTAILARQWIEHRDEADGKKRGEFRPTFENCCLMLELDPEAERARLGKVIDKKWREGCLAYYERKLELRRAAVLTISGAGREMSEAFALLLVSQDEYEDTAGLTRPDPPAWGKKLAAATLN